MSSRRPPRPLAASVRERLFNLAKERQEDFQLMLTRYALERTMYRLSRSPHRGQFVLKGAMLFSLWGDEPHRATRDLDLLGRGASNLSRLEQVFREIITTAVEDDGLDFRPESAHGERIREDQEYAGVRIHCEARLAAARIPIQVDIGFGDAVTPAPEEVEYPTLLDSPKPRLLAYRREAVVAEKFHAMVALGIANSRMKDFYDLWVLSRKFNFDGKVLGEAIRATFAQRETPLPPEPPLALTSVFYEDPGKQVQWKAFLHRTRLKSGEATLADIVLTLRDFLLPPVIARAKGESFEKQWPPAGPWRDG